MKNGQIGELIKATLYIYKKGWTEQDKIFKNIGERNPFPDPEVIDVDKLTVNEKGALANLANNPDSEVFRKVNEVIGAKFHTPHEKKISLKEAKNKLEIDLVKKIPFKDTCTLKEFYYAIPTGITSPPIKFEELEWLYKNGYFPKLYGSENKPRFERRMWFILDFVIKQAREDIGLGIFKNFSERRPNSIKLSNYVNFVTYMYNSWNIGETIMKYADQKIRKSGVKNEKFRIASLGLIRELWVNEGRALAEELINKSDLTSNTFNLIEYYRDIFALLAFEAFPSNYLIDLYHQKSQRIAVMLGYEPYLRLKTDHMGFNNINTYEKERLSDSYGLLFSATDWALSMRDEANNRGISVIVDKFRRNEINNEEKIPCKICGTLFKPSRPKIDVTCGKKSCIVENKYLSKRKNAKLNTLPIIK